MYWQKLSEVEYEHGGLQKAVEVYEKAIKGSKYVGLVWLQISL